MVLFVKKRERDDTFMKKKNGFYDSKHIDEVGRIVLPKPLRDQVGILSEKTPVQIYSEDDKIIIKTYLPGCVICGDVENTVEINEKRICKKCIEKLNMLNE